MNPKVAAGVCSPPLLLPVPPLPQSPGIAVTSPSLLDDPRQITQALCASVASSIKCR